MKRCTKCNKTKDLDEFYSRQSRCKACVKLAARVWKDNNPQKHNQSESARYHRTGKTRFKRNRDAWHAVIDKLVPQVCNDCGLVGGDRMHFHHRTGEPYRFRIGQWIYHRPVTDAHIATVREEITKCDLLCKPCHTSIHNVSRG